MQQEHYGEAASTLQPLSGWRCDPRVDLLLAAAFEGGGDRPGSEEVLRQAHLVWPSNNSIAASLAREYLSTGEAKEAAKALDHFHATAETPWQEIQLVVVVWFANHQLVDAEALARTGYHTYPSVQSLLLLANALQLEGRYKDVISLLEAKRITYAHSPPFLVTLAESEYDANLFDAARTDLQAAIAIDPKLPQAHSLLGNVLLKQGDAEQAAAEDRLAIDLAPGQPRTYYQLALALRAKQDEAGEESVLTKAIAIDSHYALAHAELGRILMNQDRLPEAVSQLSLAIEENPTFEQPMYLLAKAYDRLGETDKSDAMAKRLAAVRSAKHREAGETSSFEESPGHDTP